MELIKRHTDYAIRALLMIASQDGYVDAAKIAGKQDIPVDFLQKILRKLKKSGILLARRGVKGGFSLNKPREDITLLDIVELVQGPVAVNRCFLKQKKCPRQRGCKVYLKLRETQAGMRELFNKTTLKDLLENTSVQVP